MKYKTSIKINIPLIPMELFIFIGNEGLKKLKKEVRKSDKNWEPNYQKSGYSVENYIWMYEYNRKTLLHELMHFLEYLDTFLDCEKEYEFKAYIGEYIIDATLNAFGDKE